MAKVNKTDADKVAKIVNYAKSWAGYSFRPGETCQCANFVRYCFAQCYLELPTSARPLDYETTKRSPQGASFANSLSGTDVGFEVKASEVQGGDLVLFSGTFGDYGRDVITHVGIMLDSENFAHRPTSSRPVEVTSVKAFGQKYVYAYVRPNVLTWAGSTPSFKIFAHGNAASFALNGKLKTCLAKLFAHDGRASLVVNNKYSFEDLEVEVLLQSITTRAIKFKARAGAVLSAEVGNEDKTKDLALELYFSPSSGKIAVYDRIKNEEGFLESGMIIAQGAKEV